MMADSDWKKRVGIEINFSPESSEDDESVSVKLDSYRDGSVDRLSPRIMDSTDGSLEGLPLTEEDYLNLMVDDLGTTPPRTRIRRKERRHREREEQSAVKKSPKVFYTSRTRRRNTLDSLYLDGLMDKSEMPDSPQHEEDLYLMESNKRTKRSMKLLRGSERDMKLEQAGVQNTTQTVLEPEDERTESLPLHGPQLGFKVESCNRFMSLTSKPVECQRKCLINKLIDGQENRLELFNKISHVIRTGGDKQLEKPPWRQLSQEEHLWQNELKDLIWLELQAWHADRTLTEQDEFLCKARQKVEILLEDIMNYKFRPHSSLDPSQQHSAQSNDSGVSFEGHVEAMNGDADESCPSSGCLSMYCQNCMNNQMAALKDVEQLLSRLEEAESLFPSSNAFGIHFPLYKSPAFIDRVKTMCLWYNMTKLHRLKVLIIGKYFTFSRSKNSSWPAVCEEDSGVATDASTGDTSPHISRGTSLKVKSYSRIRKRAVQFDVSSTSSSPSDSNNSNISQEPYSDNVDCLASYFKSEHAAAEASFKKHSNSEIESDTNPFRKYIGEVLKTKGLRKAFYFLEKLHQHVLVKSMISLSKQEPTSNLDAGTLDVNANDSMNTVQANMDFSNTDQIQLEDEEEELKRYGFWTDVAQSLQLPSYRSAFLFLANIPFHSMYQLLQMRLDLKPANPSVLCIRQLMREVKETLRMAALHRERYLSLVRAVLWNVEDDVVRKFEDMSQFDDTCGAVLKLYLEYLKQWVPMVQHERFHKNLLEEEWEFVKSTCLHIPGAPSLVGHVFCQIATGMVETIEIYSKSKIKEIIGHMHMDQETGSDESSTKYVIMMVCREFQNLSNELKEKSHKAIIFAKTLVRDLERDDQSFPSNSCQTLSKALEDLKSAILALRYEIACSLESVGLNFVKWNMDHVDVAERQTLMTRLREILHLGYKFSFEYHKEITRVVTGDLRIKLFHGCISFAYQWMNFVEKWCEKGRGNKPRWACQGLEFLMFVSDPTHTCYLTDEEFQSFQSSVENCVAFIIGSASPVSIKRTSSPQIFNCGRTSNDSHKPKSRACSPASQTKSPSYRTSRSMLEVGNAPSFALPQRSLSTNQSFSGEVDTNDVPDGCTLKVQIPSRNTVSRIERVRSAVKNLENDINNKLLQQDLIGSVTEIGSEDRIHIKSRSVTFSWQRGMKIGQGRFGKVYTAVNNETGELLAMKEIQLQPNDHRTIRRVAEELRTFEGITHPHLVRYHGVEIHREEMLIFMEFCAEGTLESLVAGTECGLPELLTRRYTHQLLDAVACLHRHGVVHRDIKSANIFLTDEGNSLKLGDFGSAVKIKAHTTLPGELQGFVGTQAYMAPEVFMQTNADGHGRAADIWSVGCVVVEMSSGKRPWAEFDSNYQIMFKVGMGETPHAPPTLSEEGHQFLSLCLLHDPRDRTPAQTLLLHNFVSVESEEDYSSTLPLVLEDSLKLSSLS